MSTARIVVFLSFAVVPALNAQPARKLIDLTHPFSAQTVYWPTADPFKLRVDAAGETPKGYYYSANSFCAAEHGGTHLDAPVHFAKGMPPVEQIPLERLIAPAVVVDVQARADKDYLISVQDLVDWERTNGRIPDGAIVLFRTGWGRFYSDPKAYLGTDARGEQAVPLLRFPGLNPAAARWIVSNRKVAAVGIDTASIDAGRSELFESHQILSKAGIPGLENVAHLDQLPAKGFQVIALPMKIQGGSGAPVRIVAVIE